MAAKANYIGCFGGKGTNAHGCFGGKGTNTQTCFGCKAQIRRVLLAAKAQAPRTEDSLESWLIGKILPLNFIISVG